mmetsp:Transcript_43230/g.108319  ORF Transcript_43230/g.108319 Transcript_43230/m.108319 type:complete len:216 (+) Transcript_43230:560-1207(+)
MIAGAARSLVRSCRSRCPGQVRPWSRETDSRNARGPELPSVSRGTCARRSHSPPSRVASNPEAVLLRAVGCSLPQVRPPSAESARRSAPLLSWRSSAWTRDAASTPSAPEYHITGWLRAAASWESSVIISATRTHVRPPSRDSATAMPPPPPSDAAAPSSVPSGSGSGLVGSAGAREAAAVGAIGAGADQVRQPSSECTEYGAHCPGATPTWKCR